MLSTYTGYQITVRDLPRSLELVQSNAQVARETDYYKENIGNIKSIDEFMDDHRLFNYAMKAHGLEDMSYAKALIKKVLVEGTATDTTFVNKLADIRYKEFAETFNFEQFDTATTSFTKANEGVVDKYIRQQLEENAGADNEGVRLALYFARKAASLEITESILTDGAISKVVRTALQIPDETAFLDIDRQVELIEQKLDIEDFKDPEKLAKFIERFTSIWDATNPVATPVNILFSNNTAFGLSTDLMLTIQLLK